MTGVPGLIVPQLECPPTCKLSIIIRTTLQVYFVNVMTYFMAFYSIEGGQYGLGDSRACYTSYTENFWI